MEIPSTFLKRAGRCEHLHLTQSFIEVHGKPPKEHKRERRVMQFLRGCFLLLVITVLATADLARAERIRVASSSPSLTSRLPHFVAHEEGFLHERDCKSNPSLCVTMRRFWQRLRRESLI